MSVYTDYSCVAARYFIGESRMLRAVGREIENNDLLKDQMLSDADEAEIIANSYESASKGNFKLDGGRISLRTLNFLLENNLVNLN